MRPMDELSEQELVESLRAEDESVRLRAQRVLQDRLFTQMGPEGVLALQQSDAEARAGDVREAEATLTRLIDRFADFAEAWHRRAALRYGLLRHDEAQADWLRTLQIKPWHFGALHGLGLCLLARREYLPAAEAFRKAADVQPHVERHRVMLRQCLDKLD